MGQGRSDLTHLWMDVPVLCLSSSDLFDLCLTSDDLCSDWWLCPPPWECDLCHVTLTSQPPVESVNDITDSDHRNVIG